VRGAGCSAGLSQQWWGPTARIGDGEGVAHRKTTEKGRDTALTGEAKVAVAFDFTPVK
jgi:hypothetical protein